MADEVFCNVVSGLALLLGNADRRDILQVIELYYFGVRVLVPLHPDQVLGFTSFRRSQEPIIPGSFIGERYGCTILISGSAVTVT